ncbi:hypothetical protein SPRG_20425 [Saprolegnia parasitica CBS 223.65]|uniref:Uncharacterized protein n=1 Tax=Saprolegnia parasitica (strain CBS 223.65) TaxID=695850 RepID=A0A067C800_SAPPC|nr:hypothetical protein SPRG_20425 [Saprolegnia parasitica CBS 223.65]KDO26899.1 hypothetical protein SPRG_20425 [Saprolegnia parasitica CBS 223.65]|eukprot:XP_012202408.1 hypothetical protein SPRG_20425 [Saprolegnia parasitica CBS 223.65]
MTRFHSPRPHQTNRRSHGPEFSVVYISKWIRITSNFIAGAMIVGTAVIVAFLLWKGMFQSQYVIAYPQSSTGSAWTPFATSCVLNANGWVPFSCRDTEVAFTGALPWTTLGVQLAATLQLTPQPTGNLSSSALITTCLVGLDRSRVAVVLFASHPSDGYAACIPNGGQPMTGMFVLETTTTDAYPNGVFLLSSWTDLKLAPLSMLLQTDGTNVPIVPFTKTFIGMDGMAINAPPDTVNYYTQVNSLNRRYLMWATSNVHIIAIANAKGYSGWSYGKYSRYIGTIGWVQRHTVDNHLELLYFQIAITLISLAVLANDAYVTFQGASGLLKTSRC